MSATSPANSANAVAQDTRDYYRIISSLTADYGYILDVVNDGKVILRGISGDFERVTGFRIEELRERWLEELIHLDDRAAYKERIKSLLEGRADTTEMRIVTGRGDVRWIRDHAMPVRDNERRVVRIYGAAQDITDQKLLQDQLLHAQKMETIGRLAGGIAHDFNNILTAVIGNLDLLRYKPMDEDERGDTIQEARSAAARAADLTQRLLTFARKQPNEPRLLSLQHFLRDLEAMLVRLVGEDVRLEIRLEQDVWPVRVDPALLTQVFVNLTVNARDAMPAGGSFSIYGKNARKDEGNLLHAAGRKAYDYVKILVRDSGKGMSPETQKRLFEPFFSTKASKGSGLGLATVYGIVEQVGGSIGVASEIGSGTTFTIFLPRAPGHEGELLASDEGRRIDDDSAEHAERYRGTETLLLVEDDPWVRRATEAGLKELGYHVLVAEDGFSALMLARDFDGPIHVLVSDLVMPQMNGVEFAEQLCSERGDMRVVFVSGYAEMELIERGIRTFGAKFLSKPYPLGNLARVIRETLEGPAPETSTEE